MRHTLCAQEICFANQIQSRFFSAAQGVPIVRGAGIHQAGLDHTIQLLNEGHWVNLFPEAKVNEKPSDGILKFRWGLARLIRECRHAPIVIPLYHNGMPSILPYVPGKWNRLYLNKKLDVVFGNALDFGNDKYSRLRCYKKTGVMDDAAVRKEIIDLIQSEFQYLQTYYRMVIEKAPKSTYLESPLQLHPSAVIPVLSS